MGKFRAPAPAPGKTRLRSATAPGPCFTLLKSKVYTTKINKRKET